MARLKTEEKKAYGRLGYDGPLEHREKEYWEDLQETDGNFFMSQTNKDYVDSFETLETGDLIAVSELGDTFIPSGARLRFIDGTIVFDNAIEVPAGSIAMGEVVTLSEGTNMLLNRDNITKENRAQVHTVFDAIGSKTPSFFELETETTSVIQPDFTEQLTDNPLIFPIIVSGDSQVNKLRLKTFASMDNVRAEIKDVATGVVVRHFPDKASWISEENGFNLVSGDNVIDLISKESNSPGIINLGVSPFKFTDGQAISVEVRSTSPGLLGNSMGVPYLVVEEQNGTQRDLVKGFNSVVYIEKLEDFPEPSAGIISLADQTAYVITENSVDIGTNRLVSGHGTALLGVHETLSEIIYTGTEDFITCVDSSLSIEKLSIQALTANQVINFTSPTESERILLLRNVFTNAPKVATISDIFILDIFQCSFRDLTTPGFSFMNQNGTLGFAEMFFDITGSTFLDLGTATFNVIDYRDTAGVLVNSTFLSGLSGSANLTTDGAGIFKDSVFMYLSGSIPLSGITKKDLRYSFEDVSGISDSRHIGFVHIAGNNNVTPTGTAAAGQNVWVDINLGGNGVLSSNNERFSLDNTTTGQITNLGPAVEGTLDCLFQVDSTGPSQLYELRVLINGGVTVDNIIKGLDISSNNVHMSFKAPVVVDTGDSIRMQVRCRAAVPRDILFKSGVITFQ